MVEFFNRIIWFLLLLFLQVLVFNHIHILEYTTPLVYIYLILLFPLGTSRWRLLLWGFLLGFCIDTFSNTPGVASSTLTLMAMIQPMLLKVFVPRDATEELKWHPAAGTMGWGAFIRYLACGVLLYVTMFFLLESFSFFNETILLYSIGGSTLLTILILIAFEGIRNSRLKSKI